MISRIKGEFTVLDAKEALNFIIKAWNSVTIEATQHFWNKTQINDDKAFLLSEKIAQLAEQEQNSTNKIINQFLIQLEIYHNFDKISLLTNEQVQEEERPQGCADQIP